MNLMAWFRKHNRKIMAFVVIALMIVFTIQPVMDYLSSRRAGGKNVVAYYNDGKKITSADLGRAQAQLELLRMLGIPVLLEPRDLRMDPSQDLRQIFLGEMLFSERGTAAESIGLIRQMVSRNGLAISDEQINDIYAKDYPPNIYWLLLTKESQEAGIRMPLEMAKTQLEAIIPRLQEGATYSRLVSYLAERQGMSEQQVLETFANLLGIIEYSRIMSLAQGATTQQLLHQTVLTEETMDAQYVAFEADLFTEQAEQPGEDKIKSQFEKYKNYFAGEVSEENPYGFGYKIPDRVQLEYLAVRLDDAAATEKKPTQQEMEEFYQQHSNQPPIAYTERSNPNDPNSQVVLKKRSYPEVATLISRTIFQQRVDSKAEQILQDAKSITEVNLMGVDRERTRLTGEDVKKFSTDYVKAAEELSEKYKIKVYTGTTDLLSAGEIESDRHLGLLYTGGAGVLMAPLSQVAFSVEPLRTSKPGPFDVQPPLLYENIGPLKDRREAMLGYSGKNMMLVRVIAAKKAAEPESMDEIVIGKTVVFDEQTEPEKKEIKTVKDIAIEDLKLLAARETARLRAQDFVREANEAGWEPTIDKFNEQYRKTAVKKEEDANAMKEPFWLQNRTGLRRISQTQLDSLAVRYEGDPMGRGLLARANRERMLISELYSLVPEDTNSLVGSGTILDFKPQLSFLCIKNITIHRLNENEFDQIKAVTAVEREHLGSQELSAVFYSPKNIIKRMNFIVAREQQDKSQTASPNDVNALPANEAKN